MRRTRLLAGALACAAVSAVPGAAQETWAKLEGPAYVFVRANRTQLGVGDTLRLRAMVYSTADTAITLNVRRCGMAVTASSALRVEPATAVAECTPEPTRLAPNDSIWSSWAGVMTTPAQGEVAVRYAAHVEEGNPEARMGSLVITVWTERRAGAPVEPVSRVPFVARFAAETETVGFNGDVVSAVIERELAKHPLAALEFQENTVQRLRVPHMRYEVVLREDGRYEMRAHW